MNSAVLENRGYNGGVSLIANKPLADVPPKGSRPVHEQKKQHEVKQKTLREKAIRSTARYLVYGANQENGGRELSPLAEILWMDEEGFGDDVLIRLAKFAVKKELAYDPLQVADVQMRYNELETQRLDHQSLPMLPDAKMKVHDK